MVAPATPRIPPSVVEPVPTLKVFEPVTEVAPFKETLPVPVENVPVPVWVIEPKLWLISLAKVETPATARVPAAEVFPFKLTLPEPVVKLPVPDCEKLPKVCEMLLPRVVVPVTARVELRVVAPVTPNVPPRLVLPELTVKFLEPVIVVSPFKETLPVPVLNVPVPD